jgi:gamma-glutamylcyclotransferase (GGCT)/AIG2-like uncharacterized protein YtfP
MEENPFAKHLTSQGTYLGAGKMRGKLYDAGDYPGAIYHPESPTEVLGYVFSVPATPSFWSVLDEYEGIGPEDEFSRTVVPVEMNGKEYPCAVYLYIRPVGELAEIVSGDYIDFKRTGKPPRST